jgi:hypothetical protein
VSRTPRVLLLTSTDRGAQARESLAELVATIDRQRVQGDHVIVVRSGHEDADLPVSESLVTHIIEVPWETSLSRARNVALRYALRHRLLERADLVGFPDDDCAYLDGSLTVIAGLLRSQALVCVPYAPRPESVDRRRFPDRELQMSPHLVMQVGSFGGTFFTGTALRSIGEFDERFGLGAPLGASEDTDYLLRALAIGLSCSYRGARALVRHPYKPERPTQYYLGNVALLAKHATHGGTAWLLLRRLAQGALLAAIGRLPARQYLHAVRAAGSILRAELSADGQLPGRAEVAI